MMQHQEFGIGTLPFLSYEAVFLYLLATDAGLSNGPPDSTPTCCRLRTSRRLLSEPDADLACFCAAFGVLLGLIKIDDDVRDGGKLLSKLIHRRLSRKRKTVSQFFSKLDPQFDEKAAAFVSEHLALERQIDPIPLDEYAAPTADAFGYIFSLATRIPSPMAQSPDALDSTEKLFQRIGRAIGAAIISYDCAVDWQRDRRLGQFNPLPDQDAVESAIDVSCVRLDDAAFECEQRFGTMSTCSRVLTSVFERVSSQPRRESNNAATLQNRLGQAMTSINRRLQSWGLRREPGYVYARFDCCDVAACCDGAGEVGGCCAGGGEVGAPACCPGDCCCICSDYCAGDAFGKNRQQKELENLKGETGITRSRLSPNGVILIHGKRRRACAESGPIPPDTKVEVIEVRGFGLLVRPTETSDIPEVDPWDPE